MAEVSAKSFLKFLERSGIVDGDRLQQSLDDLSRKFNGRIVTYDDLTTHLLDANLITNWHCEKLRAGKYKGFFIGKYKLLGHLGTGGMSAVYLAEHRISGHKRAIKVLPRKKINDKSYLDRFYREGKAAAALDDKNIVRIYDIANDGDTHYMVMEFVKGEDLYELVKSEGPLEFDIAAKYVADAAMGLSHAHARKMVHRDIKPANLLLSDDGIIKILDLGLALMRETEEESLTVLYNERVMGTADYLSPEQAVNSHEVDHRADIYSLGCTLYFLLTGNPPFPTGTLAQRIAKHQTEYPTDIRDLRQGAPDALVEVCHRMMRKKPEERFQTCADVEKALREFVATGTVSPEFSPASAFEIRPRRHPPATERAQRESSSASTAAEPIVINTKSKSSKTRSSPAIASAGTAGSRAHATRSPRRTSVPTWAMISMISMAFITLALIILIAAKLMQSQANRQAEIGRPAYNLVTGHQRPLPLTPKHATHA